MSSPLAIAGVTAVIRDLLDSGMIDHQVTDSLGQGVTVSALAPDLITLGAEAAPRLNLFLHQVTPNAAWRNVGYPSRDARGDRVGNPLLALDLHYLLTAYGSADLQAEILLGYACLLLHETPVLTRNAIRTALNPPAPPVTGGLLPSIYKALSAADLAEQFEQIKITPSVMNTEELSKLWTAVQSSYRPTAAYMASVVLIEMPRPARSPLPVLSRGKVDPATKRDAGVAVQPNLVPALPEIETIAPASKQLAAVLGETLTLSGHDLDGVATEYHLLLSNLRLGIELDIGPEVAASGAAKSVQFVLSNDPVNIPAGSYTAVLQLRKPGELLPRRSNVLPLTIAPQIVGGLPVAKVALGANGSLALTPTCSPQLRTNQRVSLILGGTEALADTFNAATATPTFHFEGLLPSTAYRVRLRVDGVDSLIVDRAATPPVFVGPQVETLP